MKTTLTDKQIDDDLKARKMSDESGMRHVLSFFEVIESGKFNLLTNGWSVEAEVLTKLIQLQTLIQRILGEAPDIENGGAPERGLQII